MCTYLFQLDLKRIALLVAQLQLCRDGVQLLRQVVVVRANRGDGGAR